MLVKDKYKKPRGFRQVHPKDWISKMADILHRAIMRDKVFAIAIGREHTKYYVHAALLICHSEYFKKALSGPWKEAKKDIIQLENVDCETCKKR